MRNLTDSFQNVLNDLITAIPNVVMALLLLILAWIVAAIVRTIIQKGLVKLGLGTALGKTPIVEGKDKADDAIRSIGKIAYYIVFILFIPSILDALNMSSVSEPITNMVNQILGFLPNLLAAAIIIIVGIFVAKLVRMLVFKFLQSLNIDKWFNKVNPDAVDDSASEKSDTLAHLLANILFVIVLIPIIVVALEALHVETISGPIVAVLDQVLMMIPNVLVAIVLLVVGYYIAKFIGAFLTNILKRTGINNVYNVLGVKDANNPGFDMAQVVGVSVKILIILFFTVEALHVLQLEVLNTIGSAIILYLPFLLSALLILGVGIFFGNLLSNLIMKYFNNKLSAILVKYLIIVFAVFMTLNQLRFAPSIVNLAFVLILGSLAVAFAIAFGIGGRDFARKQLERMDQKMNQPADASKSDE